MAEAARETHLVPVQGSTDHKVPVIMWCRALIGEAGAITSYEGSPLVIPTDGGTGIVSIAFPACEKAIVFAAIEYTGDTVADVTAEVGAITATSGTVNILQAAGSDFTSGDYVNVIIYALTS